MKTCLRASVLALALFVVGFFSAAPAPARVDFTVSMPEPATHCIHVVLRTQAVQGEAVELKLPAWSPGYYKIMDFARNVVRFRVVDQADRPLPFEKTSKNTWRVTTRGATSVTVSYDVWAFGSSVVESAVDDGRAFIAPGSVLMHVAGGLNLPATVTIEPHPGWTTISTSLEAVPGKANTFFAEDFDVLYDSPILVGNQEVLRFEVRGIPHFVALDRFGAFDRTRLVGDLRRIVETAVAVVGEIPYTSYTFLALGPGRGGLEHASSTVLFGDTADFEQPAEYQRFLAFVAHEYFHLYNVKRIRPIELGPFDYDRENHTRLLWFAEGGTVYYDALIVERAGLITRESYFKLLQQSIAGYEDLPGHRLQSAEESSLDTWIQFMARGEVAENATISYYDKGAALCLLLDLSIRHATANRASLDEVMRLLYREYFLGKQRGFTAAELRAACEKVAGESLGEIFEYAATTRDIDYAKYLAYAGLAIDLEPHDLPGAWLGASTEDDGGKLVVMSVEWGSPAARAGISAGDEIVALDGARVRERSLGDLLETGAPGSEVHLLVARRGAVRELQARLGKQRRPSFAISPVPDPTPLQAAILESWLGPSSR